MTKKPAAYGLAAAGLAAALALAPTAAQAVGGPSAVGAVGVTASTTAEASLQERAEGLLAQANFSPELMAQARSVVASLPSDWEQRVASKQQQFGLSDTQWFEQSQSLINPEDYQCGSTPLRQWLSTQISGVNGFRMLFLMMLGGDQLPTYEALLFGQESKSNTFGIDGSSTQDLNRAMTSLKGFWDIDGSDIQLIPMHGDIYQDVDRMTRVFEVLYGLSHEDALGDAQIVQAIVMDEPVLNDGLTPYFTFNAFSFDPTPEEAETLGLTKRIIVGDGLLQGLGATGLDDKAAPIGILAHEYGHQVQSAKGLFESPLTGAEATRRTELMADAFGTYFAVHARGTALNAQRTLDVHEAFYGSGDCGFGNDDHHGTPNQRFKSSQFAVNVLGSAADQGHKLSALAFDAKFEQALPELVAPDAE